MKFLSGVMMKKKKRAAWKCHQRMKQGHMQMILPVRCPSPSLLTQVPSKKEKDSSAAKENTVDETDTASR
jgi:hypothetical protein